MIFSSQGSKPQLLNAAEAHNVWDLLRSNYMAAELIKLWENYANDKDFKLIIGVFIKDIEQQIELLEKELKKYGIKGPDKNRKYINTAANSEALKDEDVAQEFFIYAQENIEMMLRGVRTSTDNDGIRKLILKFTLESMTRIDNIIKYLKTKGWIETPPLYNQVPDNVKEKLGAGEAFHLWDHLTYRYDNISQTEIYYAFAKDLEFKLMIKSGLQNSLKKQAELLEKELNYFGIQLPKRPKDYNIPTDETELLNDDHMFRMILLGIQGAAIFHAQALKQCTVNDRVRAIFKELLFDEIKYNDKMIKFGKVKGWLNPVPQFKIH